MFRNISPRADTCVSSRAMGQQHAKHRCRADGGDMPFGLDGERTLGRGCLCSGATAKRHSTVHHFRRSHAASEWCPQLSVDASRLALGWRPGGRGVSLAFSP